MRKFVQIFLFSLIAFTVSVNVSFAKTRFAVIGDTQNFILSNHNAGILEAVAKRIKRKKKVKAVIAMGDLVPDNYGNEYDRHYYRTWQHYMRKLLKKTYPVMGNHDYMDTDADELWQDMFRLPTNGPEGYKESVYAFNKGNSHFVVLNTSMPERDNITDEQLSWLEQDLAQRKTQKKRHVFVFLHSPPFPVAGHKDDSLNSNEVQRNKLWDILERYKVTAVFCGHEHLFNRKLITSADYSGASGKIYQFTVGNTVSTFREEPDLSDSEYFYTGHHYVIVNARKNKVKVDLHSYNGRRIHGFTFRGQKR